MKLADFLKSLLESGDVSVSPDPDVDWKGVDEVLLDFDGRYRLTLASEAPILSLPAARWATLACYRICQLVACRNLGEGVVKQSLEVPCPDALSPQTCYSVDLVFRFLPDQFTVATRLSPNDPLVDGLRKLAAGWPLSSVGTRDVGPVSIDAFIDNPALAQLYADRIIERSDKARLDDPRVQQWLRRSWGAYPESCPELSRALEEISQ